MMATARPALLALLLAVCTCTAAAQTPVTEALLQQVGIIPDVISGVSLDPKLNFDISFPSGAVDAGNMFSINQSMAAPTVQVSCKPGACTVPRRTYYTLLMVDPDAPSPEMPTRRNIWHWGVINAPNGRITSGTAITPYRGPMPPMGIHRYVLMLFRQQGTYSAPMTPDDGRFNFDVNAFAARYNLGLPVAVNWFTTQPDAGP